MNLEPEFNYYLKHQADLVRKFNGKFIVIKNHTVLGSYEDELSAIRITSKAHELGTFLVQKCEEGSESYTQVFHSQIRFA